MHDSISFSLGKKSSRILLNFTTAFKFYAKKQGMHMKIKIQASSAATCGKITASRTNDRRFKKKKEKN